MSNVNITASISQESWELLKTGKAVLQKGGVKVDGKFIELLKPVLSKTAGNAVNAISGGFLGGVNLVSSIGCNVQCAFIQKGVNQANQKLDIVLNRMDELCKAVSGLNQIHALSWLNCAVGIANIGVSIAGFYITNKKLDSLSEKIDNVNNNVMHIINILEENELRKKITKFKQYMLNIYADIQEISKYCATNKLSIFINEREIRSMLNEIATFINELIDDFSKNPVLNGLYCNMIFSLSSLFIQEVQLFSSYYYYAHGGDFPPNYAIWEEVIKRINDNSFLNEIKRYLFMDADLLDLPLLTRKEAYQYTISLANNQALQLEINSNNTRLLTFEEYFDRDAYYASVIQKTESPLYLENGLVAF